MSVFSVDPKAGNPVTSAVLDEVCKSLGVKLKHDEHEDYRKLLAVFDESARELMEMDGTYITALAAMLSHAEGSQTMCRRPTLLASRATMSVIPAHQITPTAPGPGVAASGTLNPTLVFWPARPYVSKI